MNAWSWESRCMFRWFLAILSLLGFHQGCLVGVGAWSLDGHERIARISEVLLTGKKKDQVRTMMHGDLVVMADWEETMNQKYAMTQVLHWHKQSKAWDCTSRPGDAGGNFRCDGASADPNSMFCALAYFFDNYVRDKKLSTFPEPIVPQPVPDFLGALLKVDLELQKPEHYLRWMAILLGDLHQPLHWMGSLDFGRKVTVSYRYEQYTLLAFWEDFIARNLSSVHGNWSGVLPATKQVHEKYEINAPHWRGTSPQDLFAAWGQEVAEEVCTKVIVPLEENMGDGRREVPSRIQLKEELVASWLDLASKLTMLAGERLAFILTTIIEHRKVKAKPKTSSSSSVAKADVPAKTSKNERAREINNSTPFLQKDDATAKVATSRANQFNSSSIFPTDTLGLLGTGAKPEEKGSFSSPSLSGATGRGKVSRTQPAHLGVGGPSIQIRSIVKLSTTFTTFERNISGPDAPTGSLSTHMRKKRVFAFMAGRERDSSDEIGLSKTLLLTIVGGSFAVVFAIAVVIFGKGSLRSYLRHTRSSKLQPVT